MARRYLILAALVIAIVSLAYFWWLPAHDSKVAKLAQLQSQEIALQASRSLIQTQTRSEVAQAHTDRSRARTAPQQVHYVQQATGLHLTPDPTAPVVSFPVSDLPILSDYVESHNVLLAENKGLHGEVTNLDQQLANCREQSKVQTGKSRWFKRGLLVGAAIGAAIIWKVKK